MRPTDIIITHTDQRLAGKDRVGLSIAIYIRWGEFRPPNWSQFSVAKSGGEQKKLNPFALILSQVVIITVGDRLIHLLTGRNAVRELVALLLQISRRNLLVMATFCFLSVAACRLLLRISPRFRQWWIVFFQMGPRRNRATWDPYSRALCCDADRA